MGASSGVVHNARKYFLQVQESAVSSRKKARCVKHAPLLYKCYDRQLNCRACKLAKLYRTTLPFV